jgi:hypothetical protein
VSPSHTLMVPVSAEYLRDLESWSLVTNGGSGARLRTSRPHLCPPILGDQPAQCLTLLRSSFWASISCPNHLLLHFICVPLPNQFS